MTRSDGPHPRPQEDLEPEPRERDRDVQRPSAKRGVRVLRDPRALPRARPLTGYAVTALIRAEPAPREGHRASTFAWWDYVLSIPAPRVVVVHDLDDPRGQGAQWGEVQANIHKALGCAGVLTDGSVR